MVSVGGFDDGSVGDHGGEAFVESGGTNAAGSAQFGERPWLAGVGENRGDALIDGFVPGGVFGLWILLDRPQGEGVIVLGEFEGDAGDGCGGAMLDGERDAIVAVAAEIEIGIAPGVEFGGSAQSLSGADGSGALPGVVDDGDGCCVTSLQFAQEGEQRGDFAADILINAMQTHEGIEDQEPRLEGGDGFLETRAVGLEIEAQAGRGDHLDVEFGESGSGGGTDAVEALADDVQRVFGGIEQDPTGPRDREAAQAGGSGGDGDRQIEGEEGFAAFGFAADDPDGILGPQLIDQPAPLLGSRGETPGRLDRKLRHRRRRIATLASPAAGTALTSKNSVSSI